MATLVEQEVSRATSEVYEVVKKQPKNKGRKAGKFHLKLAEVFDNYVIATGITCLIFIL